MNSIAATLAQVASDLRGVLSDDTLAGLSDAERAEVLRGFGEVSRLVDAVVVEAVATADVEFGHRYGCRGMNELLQRALLTDGPSASKIVKAADLVHRDMNLVSGERLPARWPALRDALLDGAVGIPGLLAATNPVEYARTRIGTEERLWADEVLAGHARGLVDDVDADAGDGADAVDAGEKRPGPSATADDLRQLAATLAMVLDPDGAEPADRDARQGRFLNLGRLHKGAHRLSGSITPEVAAQLQLIFDAFNNPKVGGAPAPGVTFTEADTDTDDAGDVFNSDPRNVIDPRTPAQNATTPSPQPWGSRPVMTTCPLWAEPPPHSSCTSTRRTWLRGPGGRRSPDRRRPCPSRSRRTPPARGLSSGSCSTKAASSASLPQTGCSPPTSAVRSSRGTRNA